MELWRLYYSVRKSDKSQSLNVITDYDWLREVADKLGSVNNLAKVKPDRDWIEYLVNDASIKRPEDGILPLMNYWLNVVIC